MAYAAPDHGSRTFVIVWLAQSLSVVGSGMTGFALNVYLAQVLYPAPEQKPELALAFTVLNLGFRSCVYRKLKLGRSRDEVREDNPDARVA